MNTLNLPLSSSSPINSPPTKQRNYLAYLDGVRGVAALWVVIAHCMIWGGWYWSPFPDPKIAVDIFMILSGYLMAHQSLIHRNENVGTTRNELGNFYIRRFFRITPAYYISLVLAFLLGHYFLSGYQALRDANPSRWANSPIYDPQNIHYTVQSFFLHLTFLFGLSPRGSFSTFLPDWSLSLEMQFYALFPLLIYALRKYSYVAVSVLLLVMSMATLRVFSSMQVPGTNIMGLFAEPSFLLLKLPMFLIGMLASEAVSSFKHNSRKGALIMVFCMLIASPYSYYIRIVALILFYLGVSGAGQSSVANKLSNFLGNRITRFMADTSYGVYLFHGFFISLCGNLLFTNSGFLALGHRERTLEMMCVVVPCSYAVAIAIYHFVERPGIQLGRRIIARSRTEQH